MEVASVPAAAAMDATPSVGWWYWLTVMTVPALGSVRSVMAQDTSHPTIGDWTTSEEPAPAEAPRRPWLAAAFQSVGA